MSTDWAGRIRWILDRYEDGNRRAMGRRLDLSGQTVSAWARGKSVPSGEALEKILRTYPDLSARWLLTGEEAPRRGVLVEEEGEGPGEGFTPDRPVAPGQSGEGEEASDLLEKAYRAGRSDALLEAVRLLSGLARPGGPAGDRERVEGGPEA